MVRRLLLIALITVLAVTVLAPDSTDAQEGSNTAVTNAQLNVREVPGGTLIHQFPQNTTVYLVGRNADGGWIFIQSMDGSIRGWVSKPYLTYTPWDYNVMLLPEVNETGSVGAPGEAAPPPAPGNEAPEGESNNEAPAPPPADGALVGSNYTQLNVRTGPGIGYSRVSTLPRNTQVVIEARNAGGDWALINSGAVDTRGWVAVAYLTLPYGTSIFSAPVSSETITVASEPSRDYPIIPASASSSEEEMIARLDSLPTFYNFNYGTLRSIHRRGLANDIRANVFTKVGDSITATQPFLLGLGANDHNLGGYGYLQPTLDFFSVSPREGQANSWTNRSLAVASAFSAAGVLDVIWADPNFCLRNEAPLLCEYRLVDPAVAIIMLGSVDIQIYDIGQYTTSMRQILNLTTRAGIIPVVTTFPVSPDYIYWEKSLRFNMVLLELAEQYGAPVINLWKESRQLPNHGIGDDYYHLSQGPTFYNFNGEERQYGVTLRNLLTVQALDMLRQNVLQ